MKTKFSLLLATTALSIALFSCGNSGSTATKMEDNTAKTGVDITPAQLAMTKDPSCGMSLEGSKIADTAVYNGATYGFCSTGCKEEFKKDPEHAKFMPKK